MAMARAMARGSQRIWLIIQDRRRVSVIGQAHRAVDSRNLLTAPSDHDSMFQTGRPTGCDR